MILDVVDHNDPCLTTECKPHTIVEDESLQLAWNLVETMRHHEMPSIAANELGIQQRVIALNTDPALVMFNPKITKTFGDDVVLDETDLARKGLSCKIKRPQGIRIRFQDYNGDVVVQKYVGMTARHILHTIDTIDGLNFIDKANKIHRQQALKNFKLWKKRNG